MESVWKQEKEKSLGYRKCLGTGKGQNSLNMESVKKQENDKILEYGKCLETGKLQNLLNTESVLKQGKRQNPLKQQNPL